MPVDANGTRADMIMGSDSTVDRMNPGRFIEHYINSVSFDIILRMKQRLGITNPKDVFKLDQITIDQLFNELLEYYSIVSDRMSQYLSNDTPEQKRDHIYHVIKEGIYIYAPTENNVGYIDAIKKLEEKYHPLRGPITYTGFSGIQVTTKKPVRIASIYVIALEKTGDDWSTANSGLTQHFGILAFTPKSMQYAFPYRNQPIRAIGESEGRIYASYAGGDITADLFDRNNCAVTHNAVVDSILEADMPTNIEKVVDRNKYQIGNARPLQIIKHIAAVAGWKFVYKSANSYSRKTS